MHKIISFLFIHLFVVALLPMNLLAQNEKPATSQQTPQNKQTIKVKVSGITCSGDCKDIEKSVAKINGIIECKQVSKASATTTFEVTFDPAVVTDKEIRKAVEDTPGCENPKDRPYKVKKA